MQERMNKKNGITWRLIPALLVLVLILTACGAPAETAARTTWATIGRPATGCSTLGSALFMRVPSPAARITDKQVRAFMEGSSRE